MKLSGKISDFGANQHGSTCLARFWRICTEVNGLGQVVWQGFGANQHGAKGFWIDLFSKVWEQTCLELRGLGKGVRQGFGANQNGAERFWVDLCGKVLEQTRMVLRDFSPSANDAGPEKQHTKQIRTEPRASKDL